MKYLPTSFNNLFQKILESQVRQQVIDSLHLHNVCYAFSLTN